MTGIVSGNSLGLELTSLATLERRGAIGTAAQGQAREQTYDAVGNLVCTTDAAGGQSFNYYDVLGRVTATVTPSGQAAASLTQYWRDANGNAVMQVERASGAFTPTQAGVTFSADATDRTRASIFDRMGHVTQSMDALGQMKYFSYDERGNLAKSWFEVASGAGTASIYQVNEYDRAGRVVAVYEPQAAAADGTTSGSAATRTTYNAFGEMTSRTIDGLSGGEYWKYNNAGRVWRTNEGDGNDRAYLYDVQGRQTVELRNSGLTNDPDVTQFASESDMRTSTGGRRTVTKYDALGRVVEQKLPGQLEAQGGLQVSHMASSAAVLQSASVVPNNSTASGFLTGSLQWAQTNRVQLGWSDLSALGSGDVKVELRYRTQALNLSYYGGGDPDAGGVPVYIGPQDTAITRVFSAAEGATGALLDWTDNLLGGVDQVLGVTVYKQDLFGNWQVLVNQGGASAEGNNTITVTSPPNPEAQVQLQVRRVGTTAWTAQSTLNFGERRLLDATALGVGVYEYQVQVQTSATSAWTITATGVMDLELPPVAVIATPITTGSWGTGIYGWTTPDATQTQTLRYRATGSSDAWRTLTVSDLGGGKSGFNASVLVPGTYDYELVYSASGGLWPTAHAVGQITVTPASGIPVAGGVSFIGNANGTSTFTWPLPAAGTTATLQYRPTGTSGWSAVSPATFSVNGSQQSGTLPVLAQGTYDVEVLFTSAGVTTSKAKYRLTVPPSVPVPATMATTTLGQGVPTIASLVFENPASGDWALTWPVPAAGVTSKFEYKLAGSSTWVDYSGAITTSADGTRKRMDVGATQLPIGNIEVRVSLWQSGVITGYSTSTITTAADLDIAATLVATTPTVLPINLPVVPNVVRTGNADGSWSLTWDKPPAGKFTSIRYRQVGTTPLLTGTPLDKGDGLHETMELGPWALAPGQWEVFIYYSTTANPTLWTDQAVQIVTLGAQPVSQTELLAPATSVPPPPTTGLTWTATPGVGSTYTWTKPAAGLTASVRTHLHGSTDAWILGTVEDLGNGQQRCVITSALPNGEWDVEVNVVDASGALKTRLTSVLTVSGTTHTMLDTTAPPPAMPSMMWTPNSIGSTFSWTKAAAPLTTAIRVRWHAGGSWVNGTVQDSGVNQQSCVVTTELVSGDWDVEVVTTDATGAVKTRSTGLLTVAGTTHTLVDTTPAPAAMPGATWTANGVGSTYSWTKPASPLTSLIRVRWHGMGNPWTNGTVQDYGTNQQRCVITTELVSGQWDIEILALDGSGAVMNRSTSLLTVSGTTHSMVDTTPLPAVGAVGWSANATGGGSTFVWDKPVSNSTTTLSSIIRTRAHSGGAWTNRTVLDYGNRQRCVLTTELTSGTWDVEVLTIDAQGVVKARSTSLLTVSGTTHTRVDTTQAATAPYGTLAGIDAKLLSASDGSWSLEWPKPAAGTTAVLRYRLASATDSNAWQTFPKPIATLTTTQKVSVLCSDLPSGTYELDLYEVDGTGARTAQYAGKVKTVYVAPTRPTFQDTTPPYTPGIAKIAAQFTPNADGSWRLTWPIDTTAGATLKLQLRRPDGTWINNPYTVVTSGSSQYIDVPDTLATGQWQIDLAYMQGTTTTRISQYTANVTTPEDGVVATQTPMAAIAASLTANADGSFIVKWPTALSGTTSKLSWRVKGASSWNDGTGQITSAGGLQQFAMGVQSPGVLEFDIRYETATGMRTGQVTSEVTSYANAPGQPTATLNNDPYTPVQYQAPVVGAAGTSVLYTFTLSAEPSVTGLSFTTASGGSTLQWNKPAGWTAASVLKYRVLNTATWLTLPVTDLGWAERASVASTMPPGQYEVELWTNTSPGSTRAITGRLAVPGTAEITNSSTGTATARGLQAVVTHKVDRWGNVIEANDPRDSTIITKYFYNDNNQLIEQWQPNAAGSTTAANASITRLYYDALGRQIAVTDANGNRNEQYYDAAGHLIKEVHADDGQVTYSYSIFGERTRTSQQMNATQTAVTDYVYDKVSRLVEMDQAAVDVSTINTDWSLSTTANRRLYQFTTWDAANRKTSETNGAFETSAYQYDLRGNVIRAVSGGITMRYAYDAQGRKTNEQDGNSNTSTWTYDYFGQLKAHKDLGGATYSYTYNNARQLVAESNSRVGAQKKNVLYTYDIAGQLTRIEDVTLGKVSTFTYDLAGHHVRERVQQTTLINGVNLPVVYQDNFMAYDALGRLAWTRDGRSEVTIDYDKVGNRQHVTTSVMNGMTSEQSSNSWFFYDAMNRQVFADVNADGTLGDKGHRIAYDKAGNKVSDSWIGNVVQQVAGGTVNYTPYGSGGAVPMTQTLANTYKAQVGLTTETYTRDALGRIKTITRDGTVVDSRYYDAGGRLVQSGQAGLDSSYLQALNSTNGNGAVLDGNGSEIRKSQYDGAGRMAAQSVLNSDGTLKYNAWYNTPNNSGLNVDGAGNVLGYRIDQGGHSTDYTFEYDKLEGYEQKTIRANRDGQTGTTTNTFDAAGNLVKVDDDKQDANDRTFVNDAAGKVLYVNQDGHIQRQTIVNGEVLGRYGEAVNDLEARSAQGVPQFKTVADFAFASKAAGGDTPNLPDMQHTVGAGDTMEALAQSYLGDSRLWYRIAEANGLSSNEDLRAGQVLKIPGTESNGNASNTFRPYQPGEIVGDTSPYVPLPAPKKSSFFGQLLAVVAAVVAAYLTQQWYLVEYATAEGVAYTGATLAGSTLTVSTAATYGAADMAIAGAIGGAAGSVASQAVGIATGAQRSLSWRSLASSSISGGIGSGLGSLASSGGVLDDIGPVGRAVVGNVAAQGLGVATGLQSSFSWKNVAASAVGAGVGQLVGPTMGDAFGKGTFGARLATGLAAGTAAAVARGGRVTIQQVATDAMGNALGDSLVDLMQPGDPLGDFINEKVAAQERRDIYGLAGMGSRLSQWTAGSADITGEELARRKFDVEDQVHLDLLGQEQREAALSSAQMFMTGGPARAPIRGGIGNVEMVRNGNWDAALNIGADPYGVIPDFAGLQQDMGKMSRGVAEDRIEGMRQRMTQAGVKNVPTDYRQAWTEGGALVPDYKSTVEDLRNRYEDFVRDKRLQETWGDNYQSLRLGKSQMTVLEFEKRVLDVQQQATNKYYDKGIELIAKGDLQINGDYARTLGNYIDQQVRTELRFLAKGEGINDSMASNLWAVNRSIRSDLAEGRGIPDNRLGYNLFADTTLARKNGYTEQIMKWNTIRPEANYLMVRPIQLGGSYVIPRTAIQPYDAGRMLGRRL